MQPLVPLRNVDVDPDESVDSWPFEAVQTVLERGLLSDWRLLARAIDRDPWGPVAQRVGEALSISRPYGTAELFDGVIAEARARAAADERAEVAAEVRALLAASGCTAGAFAARIGTSASRLSTYCSGRVTPSAALLVRMRRVSAPASTARAAGG